MNHDPDWQLSLVLLATPVAFGLLLAAIGLIPARKARRLSDREVRELHP